MELPLLRAVLEQGGITAERGEDGLLRTPAWKDDLLQRTFGTMFLSNIMLRNGIHVD